MCETRTSADKSFSADLLAGWRLKSEAYVQGSVIRKFFVKSEGQHEKDEA
jgi:hypothetical protein